ncbi:MAG TPA: hypothetical protein VEC57_20500 [Candidatus Limnocylindrales bacterium]|nr:hypothetical protein [Candidatus Limnocylindrales bacterium]
MIDALQLLARGVTELLDPPIVQLGPPRTGSTLVWNALRAIFPSRIILKRHALTPVRASILARSRLVCTVRHPLDALASSILRSDAPVTAEQFERHVADLELPLRQILALQGRPRARVLRYERFVGDLDGLLDELAAFFAVPLDDAGRCRARQRCDIEAAERLAQDLGSFSRVDPDTQIHGRHISAYRGASGYYGEVLSTAQLAIATRRLGRIAEAFGYRQ